MSRAAKYRTDIHHLVALQADLRAQQPAPTIRATATPADVVRTYTSNNAVQERGQATVAVGRAGTRLAELLDTATRILTTYAVDQALSRHAAEDPPMFAQLVAALGYPSFEQDGGEG